MKARQTKKPKYLNPATVLLLKQIFLGLLVFASVSLLISAVWYITRLEAFSIRTVNVSGGYTIDKQAVKKLAEAELEGTYLKLIPKRFSYFYPETVVLEKVSQFERIKDVEVERVSRHELAITFGEYVPDALWCDIKDVKECYFLDDQGFAFAVAPDLSGASLLRYYSPEIEPENNKYPFATTTTDYQNAKQLAQYLNDYGWFVTTVEINSNRDAFYTFGAGGEIKATLTLSATDTMENLLTLIGSEEFAHLAPGNFQYLDLRFDTRVFVNEELPVSTSTATTTVASEAEGEGEQVVE
ncbi:MAG TPA: hypothetical protein PKD95_02100 [Candidatus Paceibacterota bacterium]|nr:hypothetical protein [Candidatus Paceibacterota bacterium]